MSDRDWELTADRLAARAMADREPVRWFDELWTAGERDDIELPWDRSAPHPVVVDHVTARGNGNGRSAVVVGAGLGADAEFLADGGWRTVAFDVSPAAVRVAQNRHPHSRVEYRVADVLELPSELVGAFELVVEVFTVQALPPSLRAHAVRGVRSLLAPGGELLVVEAVRADDEAAERAGPPWLLTFAELATFADDEVVLDSLARLDRSDAPSLWVGVLHRHAR